MFAILLAGCILIGASSAADIDVTSIDASDSYLSTIDQNSLGDLDDSSIVESGINNAGDDNDVTKLKASEEGNFTELNNLIQSSKSITLDKDYRYTPSDVNCITITKDIVIDGNGHTIYGSNQNSIFRISAANVTIINLNFVNNNLSQSNSFAGGAIYYSVDKDHYDTIHSVYLINCTFNSKAKFGGAIYLNNSGKFVRDKSYNYYITNCTFNGNSAEDGGAIYCNGKNDHINIDNCKFLNVKGGTTVSFNFINSSYIANCTFSGSTHGGISLYSSNNNTIINCTFISCHSTIGGGGICSVGGSNNSVSNCIFDDCYANTGGAIYNWLSLNFSITNSTFNDCDAYNGGVIYNWASHYCNVSNCIFNSCHANMKGNVIYNNQSTGCIYDNNFFTTNDISADEFVNMGLIYDSNFTDGVAIAPNEFIVLNIKESSKGYTIQFVKNGTGTVVDMPYFEFDVTLSNGSTYVVPVGVDQELTDLITNISVYGRLYNTSKILLANSTILLDTFTHLAIEIAGWDGELSLFHDYKYYEGIDDSYINGIPINRAIVINGNGHTLDAMNLAKIFNITSNDVSLTDINFINANASNSGVAGEGAGIYWYNSNNGSINNCNFTDIYANYNGGAIYFVLTNCSVNNCIFTNVSTNTSGGAVYVDRGNVYIKDSTFNNTRAEGYNGGAIYAAGNTTVENCGFTNTYANRNGPAIFVYSSSASILNITDSTYTPVEGNEKAAIYNNGVISSDLVITTLGEDKIVYPGESTNLTANITTGGLSLTSGSITFKVAGEDIKGSSDVNGLYSAPYTVSIAAVLPVKATYINSTGNQVVNSYNIISGNNTSFTQLAIDIGNCEGNVLVLTHDYKYYEDEDVPYRGGITLNKKGFTIDGNGHTLDAMNLARIFSIIASNVTLKNINFINANLTGYGGAIQFETSNILIDNCNFTNCNASNGASISSDTYHKIWNITISNCNFVNSTSLVSGNSIVSTSAIYLRFCVDSNITNCTFNGCNASIDGTICISDSNNITVNKCKFTNCTANDGGAIYIYNTTIGTISNCTFVSCNCTGNGSYGGAIMLLGTNNTNVLDSNFINCSAEHGGGAIELSNSNNCTIGDCIFINTSSQGYSPAEYITYGGGAIELSSSNNCTICNCTFRNTSSIYGGAILYSSNNVNICDCAFTNTSATYGGAIYFVQNGGYVLNGTISNCIFNNTSATYGGAIMVKSHVSNGTCIVDNCDFIKCSADLGSAILLTASPDYSKSSLLSITNSTCTPVKGDLKAPIYNNGTIISDIVITTLNGVDKFVTNFDPVNITANVTASGIPVAGGIITLKVNNTELNTSSDIYGLYSAEYTRDYVGSKLVTATYLNSTGAQDLYAFNLGDDDSFTQLAKDIANCKGNVLVLSHNYRFYSDKDADLKWGIALNKTGFTIEGNGYIINGSGNASIFNVFADNITVKNIEFVNSVGSVGSAINWVSGDNGSVINCTFNNTYADNYGSAIDWASNANNGAIVNCTFNNCLSEYKGGAIRFGGYNGLIFSCNFTNISTDCNSDYAKGGAIYFTGDKGSILYCVFTNTSSKGKEGSYGGAICFDDAVNVIVFDCNFTNISTNSILGSTYGGAIYSDSYSSDCSIFNSSFDNCSANNGGAIYCCAPNSYVVNSNFNNSNAINGGAIYFLGDNCTIVNCDFNNTNASSTGGAIYWSGSNGIINNSNIINSYANNASAIYIDKSASLNITNSTCTPVADDLKAPIYNNGTILSEVVITTLDGKERIVNLGDEVVITANITASGIPVAGGIITLKVNNTEVNASSDINGLYSASYVTDFLGIKPVDATYLNATNDQSVENGYLISVNFVNITVEVSNSTYGDIISGTIDKNNGTLVFIIDNKGYNATVNDDGTFTIINSDKLNAGSYTNITATYIRDEYEFGRTDVDFTIKPKEIDMNGSISDGTYGDNLTGAIDNDGRAGIIFVEINDGIFKGNVATDGSFIVNDTDYVPVGNYSNIGFIFYSDDGNIIGNGTTNFTIGAKVIDLNTSVNDGTYGDNLTGVIDNAGYEGTLLFVIDGKVYNATVDSEGNFIINGTDSLNADTYNNVDVTFLSKDCSVIGSDVTNFTIRTKEIPMNCSIKDSIYGDNLTGVLDNNGAEGIILVEINGGIYKGTVKSNGAFTLEDTDYVPAGNYTNANVAFISDNIVSSGTTNFTINPKEVSLSIEFGRLAYGVSINGIVNAEGYAPNGNISFVINGTVYNGNIDDLAYFALNGTDSLNAGNYTNVSVSFISEDGCYVGHTNISFTILPAIIDINATVNNITYGDNLTGTLNTEGKTGNVSVTINGTVYTGAVDSDGKFTLNGTDSLNAGHYENIRVSFISDDGNYQGLDIVNYTISPKEITILTFMDDSVYGDNLTGTLNASGKTGNVSVTINGTVYTGAVDSDGKFTLNGTDSLNAGHYQYIPVTFISDDGCYVGYDDCAFNIERKNITINATVNNISYGDNLSGSVSADLPGMISIYPGEGPFSYEFNTTGPFTTELEELLGPGDYEASIFFLSDDGNYRGFISVNYTISKATAIISVDPVSGKEGDKSTITVRVNNQKGQPVQEGTVTVSLDGKKYTANVVNGIATIEVTLPSAGSYTVNVCYEGNNYEGSMNFTIKVANKTNPSPNPNPNPNPIHKNTVLGNERGMENTGNPILVLLIALAALGLESFRRKL